MVDRWWAPTRATVEPDAVVLALLQPDGQAVGDFGATLLAIHRAGAAAVETVSKSAAPSEIGLINVLADARSKVAGLVVDAAASSLEPVYAGLLVRDIFDDAEQGAITLYRAAISKGVSRPTAIERVSAVYGVPYRQLGGYAVMATDPKANPAALADAADRVLLTYVSKTIDAEVGEEKELVSKASTATLERTRWDESLVSRDSDGQFSNMPRVSDPGLLARLRSMMGVGGQSAPVVATEPATATPQTRRKPRLVRTARRVRTLQTETKPATAAQVQTAQAVSGRAKGAKLTAKQAETHQMIARLEAQHRLPFIAVRPSQSFPKDVMVARGPVNAEMQDSIPAEYDYHKVYSLTSSEGHGFLGAMGGTSSLTESKKIFRLGYLSDATGGGQMIDSKAEPGLEARAALAETAATETLDIYDVPELPYEVVVSELPVKERQEAEDLDKARGGRKAMEALIKATIKEQLSHEFFLPNGQKVKEADPANIPTVFARLDYDDKSTMLLVRPPVPYQGGPIAPQQLPLINEFYLMDPKGEVQSEGSRYADPEIVLDENQVYLLGKPEFYYDKKRSVLVNRYPISAIDESDAAGLQQKKGFGEATKSLDIAERTSFNQEHPRAGGGRFTNKMEQRSTVTPTTVGGYREPNRELLDKIRESLAANRAKKKGPTPIRRVRRIRTARRVNRPVQATTYETTVGLPSAQSATAAPAQAKGRVARAREAVARIMEATTPKEPAAQGRRGRRVLDDNSVYRVMNKAAFDRLIEHHGKIGRLVGNSPNHLRDMNITTLSRGMVLGGSQFDAEEAVVAMRSNVKQAAKDVGLRQLDIMEVRSDTMEHEARDHGRLAHRAAQLLHQFPHLAYINLVPLSQIGAEELSHWTGIEDLVDDELPAEPDADIGIGDENDAIEYALIGNKKKIDPVYLIQMDRHMTNQDLPMVLSFQGSHALNGPEVNRPGVKSDGISGNAEIRHYRAEYQHYTARHATD